MNDSQNMLNQNLEQIQKELSNLMQSDKYTLLESNVDFKVIFPHRDDPSKAIYKLCGDDEACGIRSSGLRKFGGGTNYKKYPMRSDKSFKILPVVEAPRENGKVNIRALSIGPKYYFQSDESKLIDKIKACCNYLHILSTERQNFNILFNSQNCMFASKTAPNPIFTHPPEAADFHNLDAFFRNAIFSVENEFAVIENVVHQIETICRTWAVVMAGGKNFEVTNAVLEDYLSGLNGLKLIENSGMLRKVTVEFLSKDDAATISNVIDEMSDAIRNTHVYLWSMKGIILKSKVDVVDVKPRDRNIFIGA